MSYDDVKDFFKKNKLIKELLLELAPNSNEDNFKYGDRLYDGVKYLKEVFEELANNLGVIYKEKVDNIFKLIMKEIENSGYSFDRLKKIYYSRLSDMSPDFIESVNKNIHGYAMFLNINEPMQKVITLNELLHLMHSVVMNDDNMFLSMPLIEQKGTIGDYYTISVRGKSSPISDILYNALENLPKLGETNIITIDNNKSIVMIRDLGHATTIEVTLEDDFVWIEYFIPKLINIDMINSLPGVRKVNKDSTATRGVLRVPIEDLENAFHIFVSKLPDDFDRPKKGEKLIRRV